MANQLADYEITGAVADDGVLPCLSARQPARLGQPGAPATIWVLGPLARAPWAAARGRLEPVTGARSDYLPDWLEAGVGEWSQRPVVWASATNAVLGTLASALPTMDVPARLRAIAGAAKGAHALHERGQLHAAICPQAVALWAPAAVPGDAAQHGAPSVVLGPPALADGQRPLLQVGYPPLTYVDPQLLRGEGGRWSDIWALGATVRYAVGAPPPFPGVEDVPVVRALAQLLLAPAAAPADMPGTVGELVDRCLSIDPEARPATASEVADRLEEAAAKW